MGDAYITSGLQTCGPLNSHYFWQENPSSLCQYVPGKSKELRVKIKTAIVKRYNINDETYQQRFRSTRPEAEESFAETKVRPTTFHFQNGGLKKALAEFGHVNPIYLDYLTRG